MSDLQPGSKIEFCLYDKKGKAHWYPGLIHGVRKYEEPSGIITSISYLIDTGEDLRVDEYAFDHREREINKRVNALVKKGAETHKAVEEVLGHSDLPASKPDVELVRQPLQIELTESLVRKR